MPYSPGVSDRSGELVAEGLRQGNSNLAQAMMGLFSHWMNKKDEAAEKTTRGIQARAALSKLDPDNKDQYDSMSADDALGVASVLPEVVQQTRAKKSQSALAGFFTGVNKDTTSRPDLMATLARGNGPTVDKAQTPVLSLRDAIISNAMRNPGAMDSPMAGKMFGEAIHSSMMGSKNPPQLMDLGGTKVIWDSTTGKFIAPRLPNSKPIRTPSDSPSIKSPDGKMFWDYGTSAWKPIPGGNKPSFMDLMGSERGAGSGEGGDAAAAGGDQIPTVASQDDYDALESGAQYLDAQGNVRKKK